MKKFQKRTAVFLMALAASITITPQALAAGTAVSSQTMASDMSMAQLRIQDKGPDLSKGALVSEVWSTEEDGTPYVERTYVKYSIPNPMKSARAASSGSARYTKTKSYGATGAVEVSADFEWDSAAKTVYASGEDGALTNSSGISDVENEQTSTSGNGTSKATVKFSCRVNRNIGGWTTYSVSVSCNYKGSKS